MQTWEVGRAPPAPLMLKLALCASTPPLTAGEYSPRALRLITKRIVSILFFKVVIPFLKKRESWC